MSPDHPAPPAPAEPPEQPADTAQVGHAPPTDRLSDLARVSLAALGVVYGDIGTSPLYAIKECFSGEHGVDPTRANVLGVLSLVFWSLTFIIVVKYLTFVLRADNRGEGGTMALLALLAPRSKTEPPSRTKHVLILLALFGCSLLYGDGMITPAISVLGAMEGLAVAAPGLRNLIVPITVGILVALFLLQKRGTARVGAIFGPATLIWFISIAAAGAPWIYRQPEVLWALNPVHALSFFVHHGLHGLLLLGSVVLCITGGEALYADMGHFGRRPIRVAWYAVVMPALLINYFGQGALLIALGDEARANPFYKLVSGLWVYPLLVVATVAAIIASQAMISGAFSLTRQAVQLGFSPRLSIVHTSGEAEGQIYVREVNTALMVACIALVLVFRESSNLAAAYGMAVTGTMNITTVLFCAVARECWGWSWLRAGSLTLLFFVFDLPFLIANLAKIPHGGWLPLVVAAMVFSIMTTWKQGRTAIEKFITSASLPLDAFLEDLERRSPHRVKGTAVFMTSNPEGVPVVLLHHFKHNKVLHEQVVLLSILTEREPEVPAKDRVKVRDLGQGFFHVTAHYGFMQTPNVPEIMRACRIAGLKTVQSDTSYYLGRETLLTTGRSGLARWRKALFAFLSRNARPATYFFGIPPNRVVEMGAQIEL
ncbi:MAG: potassium transporter Kup [Myxococcales bacterium]|nr:potassium transporter Kup [Myxococcota bacterium]MDW8284076.1 potassium transporter Kup [Myxococcales bacterium]